jgi:hypothetical protein
MDLSMVTVELVVLAFSKLITKLWIQYLMH